MDVDRNQRWSHVVDAWENSAGALQNATRSRGCSSAISTRYVIRIAARLDTEPSPERRRDAAGTMLVRLSTTQYQNQNISGT